MNRSILTVIILLTSSYAYAQKWGYVDTDYILRKIPEYKKAQDEINTLSLGWQQEIQNMEREIQDMYSKLNAEEVLLTDDMKAQRTAEIRKKEEDLREYNKKVFGFEGLLFLKKKELIQPIQDKVFAAVEKVAKENRLQLVFDKAGSLVLIYTDPVQDYTDFVLEEMGLGDPNDAINANK
jgi:outer membrane protein